MTPITTDRLRMSLALCDEHTRTAVCSQLRSSIGHAIIAGNVREAWAFGELLRLVADFEQELRQIYLSTMSTAAK